MAGEEEVMKMRLLMDGEGQGDDRRINMLLKILMRWCNSDEDETTCEMSYERMQAHLAHIEWVMQKSRRVASMNEKEMQNYELLRSTIEEDINAAKQQIEDTKEELAEAKIVRKNRLEYDQLARTIHKHPDRDTSKARIESLDEEKSALREKEKVLEEKLETRKRQFTLLFSTLHQLQTLLEDEDGKVKSSGLDSSQESLGNTRDLDGDQDVESIVELLCK